MDWKLILQIAGVALGLLYLWLEYRADIRLWIVGLVMPLVHGTLYYKAGLYADCSMQVYYVLAGLYGWLVWRNAPHKKARTARSAAAGQNAQAARSAEPAAEHDGQPDRTTTAAGQTARTAAPADLTARQAARTARSAEPAAGHDSQPDRTTTAAEQAARATGNAAAEQNARTARNAEPTAGHDGQSDRNAEPAAARIGHTPLRYAAGLIAVYAAAHAGIYFLLSRFTNSTVPFWDAMTTAASIVAMWMLSRKYVEQWLVWLAVDLITVGLYLYKGIPLTAGLYALYSALAVAGYLRWRREAALRS